MCDERKMEICAIHRSEFFNMHGILLQMISVNRDVETLAKFYVIVIVSSPPTV